jgi:hypothetical protein
MSKEGRREGWIGYVWLGISTGFFVVNGNIQDGTQRTCVVGCFN